MCALDPRPRSTRLRAAQPADAFPLRPWQQSECAGALGLRLGLLSSHLEDGSPSPTLTPLCLPCFIAWRVKARLGVGRPEHVAVGAWAAGFIL